MNNTCSFNFHCKSVRFQICCFTKKLCFHFQPEEKCKSTKKTAFTPPEQWSSEVQCSLSWQPTANRISASTTHFCATVWGWRRGVLSPVTRSVDVPEPKAHALYWQENVIQLDLLEEASHVRPIEICYTSMSDLLKHAAELGSMSDLFKHAAELRTMSDLSRHPAELRRMSDLLKHAAELGCMGCWDR